MTLTHKMPRYWIGKAPKCCDVCGAGITATFSDAKTYRGPWATMCDDCLPKMHISALGRASNRELPATDPMRYGTGLGQRYERQADGRFLKVAG